MQWSDASQSYTGQSNTLFLILMLKFIAQLLIILRFFSIVISCLSQYKLHACICIGRSEQDGERSKRAAAEESGPGSEVGHKSKRSRKQKHNEHQAESTAAAYHLSLENQCKENVSYIGSNTILLCESIVKACSRFSMWRILLSGR